MKALFGSLLLVLLLGGCVMTGESVRPSLRRTEAGLAVKPVVVVSDFENRAGFSGQWNLGSGMADILVSALMKTGEVVIIDQRHMKDIQQELSRQNSVESRSEGRARSGRLKNARYLIRGAITDFTVAGDASGWFGISEVEGRIGGSSARVDLQISVSDIETGEVISSVHGVGRSSRGFLGARVNYPKISFGGEAFFRTPLGEATAEAVMRATSRMLSVIPLQMWEARVADVGPYNVVINGGENVGLKAGSIFVVREKGREVTDPLTGEAIYSEPGAVVGRLEVTRIMPMAAVARLLEGRAERGDYLSKVDEPGTSGVKAEVEGPAIRSGAGERASPP